MSRNRGNALKGTRFLFKKKAAKKKDARFSEEKLSKRLS